MSRHIRRQDDKIHVPYQMTTMETSRTHHLTTMAQRMRKAILVAATAVYLSGETVMPTSAFTPLFGSGSSSSSSSLPPSRSVPVPVPVPTSSRIICYSRFGPKMSIPRTTTLRVCQNKHCRKRVQREDILQTVHNLLDLPSSSSCGTINIVSTGCLSECDKGPNIEVEVSGGTCDGDISSNNKILLHGMKDAQLCVTQFNMLSSAARTASSSDNDDDDDSSSNINMRNFDHLKPNKVLVAASKVIEQTLSLKRNDEKVRYLSSIIDTLDTKTSIQRSVSENDSNNTIINNDSDVDVACTSSGFIDYTASAVYAHAHALRAQAYVEMGTKYVDIAIQDAQRVVSTIKLSSSSAATAAVTQLSITLAYRSWVDAEHMKLVQEQRQEEQPPSGLSTTMMGVGQHRPLVLTPGTDTSRIRSVLQQWLIDQPSYRIKIEEELKNLTS